MRLDKGWNSYLFEYYHDGSWWCFEIPARSEQEARERVNKLPNAKHLGIIEAKLPGHLGLFAKLICWARNLITSP